MDFFNQTFCDQMRNYGVLLGTNMFMFGYFIFQSPCSMLKNSVLKNCSLGSFSYISYSSIAINTHIGRYCSISSSCQFGAKRQDFSKAVVAPFLDQENCFEFAGFSLDNMHVQSGTPYDHREVINVGNDVWIGFKALIQEGVNIGTGAVIGANAVITKDVPPYAVVVGTDRILRQRFSDEVVSDLLDSHWWDYNLPLMAKQGIVLPYEHPEKLASVLAGLSEQQKIKLPDSWIGIRIPENCCNIQAVTAKYCSNQTVDKFFEKLKTDSNTKLF